MRIFSITIDGKFGEKYKECWNKVLKKYPRANILNFPSNGMSVNDASDFWRIDTIANKWIDDSVLYIDLDCIPGASLFQGLDNPGAACCVGGSLDCWALYRPQGKDSFFKDILGKFQKTNNWLSQFIANNHAYDMDRIEGYPDSKYFSHLYLSRSA